jgi:voltage-gated sodium channel
MQQTLKKLVDAHWFQNTITAVIVFAGVLVGFETYPALAARHHGILHFLDTVVLGVFTLEVVLKIGAEGKRPWRYFADPWNVFDFLIVAACFLPFSGSAITVLRLLRLLRVLKLLKALPKLQVIVTALLKSIPSMAYVSMLLGLLFYVYGVAGVFMFGQNDPMHFKDLPTAMVTLFSVVTLEGWVEIMYINMFGCENYGYAADSLFACPFTEAHPSGMVPLLGGIYFISFVLMGTMIVLNLFIGVIMGGMSEAQDEAAHTQKLAEREARGDRLLLDDELCKLREDLARMQTHITTLERVARSVLPNPVERPVARVPDGVAAPAE